MSGRWLATQVQITQSNQINACTFGHYGLMRDKKQGCGILTTLEAPVKDLQTRIVVLVLSRAWRTSSPTFPMGLNLVDQELGLRDFLALPNQIFPGLSDGRAPSVLPWVERDFGEGTPGLGFIAQNLAGVGLILSRSILTRMLALGPNGVESQACQSMLILISHQGSSL